MELNEEEKIAIDWLNYDVEIFGGTERGKISKILLSLIEKYQKELENLSKRRL